jgi:diguanylate cyclase (GGDEF)-like protein/PAS domain S-box-containing protein
MVNSARWLLIPLLTLSVALSTTWLVFDHERQANSKERRSQFDFALRETVGRIEQRVASYEQMLRGVQALFSTAAPDRTRLHDYLEMLPAGASFPGVQYIGFVEHVPAESKGTHIASMRQNGWPRYAITPNGQRDVYAPVTMRESYGAQIHIEPGFDAWSDNTRRLAMELARDSGMAAISGKVQLRVDADVGAPPGLIMYLPIYARGQAHDSVAQRRANLTGWVFASFHMDQLVASLYGEPMPGLRFALYDGVEPSPAALLYKGDEAGQANMEGTLTANEYVVAGAHTWTLSLTALPAFEARYGRSAAWLIAGAGVGLSVLLAMLAWLLTTGRTRAVFLAEQMTGELRQSEEHFRTFFEKNSSVMLLIEPESGSIVSANTAAAAFYGYPSEVLTGMLISDINTLAPELIAEERQRAWRSDRSYFLFQHQLADGTLRDVEVHSTPINRNGSAMLFSIIHDITDRKQALEKIEELAFFDTLTHLPNRTLLVDRLKQAMTIGNRNNTYGAVLFIDLDQFKTLNDTFGHDKGDLLLQQVSQRLVDCVRQGDTVARLGGDEFVIVLANLSDSLEDAASQTEAVGKKVLAALNQKYRLADLDHRSTASIGATLFLGLQTSIDDLLKQADLAMYKSKDTGRNALRFFDPHMQVVVMQRARLEVELRQAIQENQFVLHYQPQVVDGGRVTGAEALVRWMHPERGMVPPAQFIPLAEDCGLIFPLGQWVLARACEQLTAWAPIHGLSHLTLAVNVSVLQFREPRFVDDVLAVLKHTGANPARLKLELTESLLADSVQEVIDKMATLKAHGVGFSLDDFGTGYSSLSYLKRLPLDQLKIDQSFVRDILTDPNDAAIASTVVALAQSLGLDVMAEGVETGAQRDFLATAGCHAYQGFYFSRPLAVDRFEAYAMLALEAGVGEST